MTDKELLTLAAKAAGIEWSKTYLAYLDDDGYRWNPLVMDDHALRLAVKLDMNIEVWSPYQEVWVVADGFDVIEEPWGEDKVAATRRAIVRAAAEIGRGMG